MKQSIHEFVLEQSGVNYILLNKALIIEDYSGNLFENIKLEKESIKGEALSDVFYEFLGLDDHLKAQYNENPDKSILYNLTPIARIVDENTYFYKFTLIKYGKSILFLINDITQFGAEFRGLVQAFHENSLLKTELSKTIENRNRYLAYLVHELRNPLNSIYLSAQILFAELEKGTSHHTFATFILNSAEDQLKSINDILDLSKIESNNFTISLIEFDLNLLIREIISKMLILAEDKNIKLHNKIPENSIIFSDFSMLYTVLSNIIENAIKYTETGKVEIHFIKEEDHFDILVKDTGLGIPKDIRKKIFDIYQRGKTKKEIVGSGIGLGIVKKLVTILNGEVWIEDSGWGKGCQFHLSFKTNNDDDK